MNNYFEKAEKALDYLRESEDDFARLKAAHQAKKKYLDVVKASLVLESPKKTYNEKKAWSESASSYKEALVDWEQSMEDFYLVDAKRFRANQTIEMFRSVNSSMKKGNI